MNRFTALPLSIDTEKGSEQLFWGKAGIEWLADFYCDLFSMRSWLQTYIMVGSFTNSG